jgi:ferritin-like metal-binding protein YciE
MKTSQCKAARATIAHDEFETALVAELRHLRTCEKALQSMYPRLKSTPQLRGRFLQQLAEMQLRAERLDAVLNPVGAFQFAAPAVSALSASVA